MTSPREQPMRKQLRIQEYDYSRQNAYFVTICIHDRVPLFGSVEKLPVGAALRGRPNRPDLLVTKWLMELEYKFPGVLLDSYCVMPDHIHFILIFDRDATYTLPQVIGWYKTMTTNAYIRGVKDQLYAPYKNQFWQRTYFEHIIRNEIDLYETRKYIEENPIRWLLCKQEHT